MYALPICVGLPTILGAYLPIFVLGVIVCPRRELFYVLCWTVFAYSLLGHKEFRYTTSIRPLNPFFRPSTLVNIGAGVHISSFIFPILPIAHIYAGYFLQWTHRPLRSREDCGDEVAGGKPLMAWRGVGPRSPDRNRRVLTRARTKILRKGGRRRLLFYFGCTFLVLTHGAMAYYFAFWHQRSPIDVMRYIRDEVERLGGSTSVPSWLEKAKHLAPSSPDLFDP